MSEADRPDLIFYDPYSYKTNGPLWSLAAFRSMYRICGEHDAELLRIRRRPVCVRRCLQQASLWRPERAQD